MQDMETPAAFFGCGSLRASGFRMMVTCITAVLSGEVLLAQEPAAPGALDSSFQAPIRAGRVETVLVQPDGWLMVGGSFTVPGQGDNLMRLTRDGVPDSTF